MSEAELQAEIQRLRAIAAETQNTAKAAEATFVFQPGGAAGGNVYTSWASLMAAVGAVQGPKCIEVDSSIAPAAVAVGTWDVDDCTIRGLTIATLLTIGAGAKLSASHRLTLDGLAIETNGGAPALQVTTNGFVLILQHEAQLISTAAASPFLQVSAAQVFCWLYGYSQIAGANPVVTVDAGETLYLYLWDTAYLVGDAVEGAGTLDLHFVDSARVTTGQLIAATNTTLDSVATQQAYTPGAAGNWNPEPATSAAALDQLAAPNYVQAVAAAQGPAASVDITTGNIAKKRSGVVRVTAFISCLTSAQDNVTFTLQRDGVNIAGSPTVEATSAGANDYVTAHMTWYDTLPDANNHTYSITATHTAANLTQAANSGAISAQEL